MITHFRRSLLLVLPATLLFAGQSASALDDKNAEAVKPGADKQSTEKPKAEASAKEEEGWMPLFNGKDLEGWKVTNFGGEGDVFVENGEVVITQGADLSGIHTEKTIPKINYEVVYEAQRAAGSDFFAGVTFPVGESTCSLILGGWGGGVCGLSSLNGLDASENQTSTYQEFEKGKWYKVRLVVKEDKIEAWLDDKQIVDCETKGQRITVRFEVEKSKPFGFATWQTTGRIRNAKIRTLPVPK